MIFTVRELSSEEREQFRLEWNGIHSVSKDQRVLISAGDAELLHVKTKPTEQVEAEHKINFREFL